MPKSQTIIAIPKWRKQAEKVVIVPLGDGDSYCLPLDVAHHLKLEYLR